MYYRQYRRRKRKMDGMNKDMELLEKVEKIKEKTGVSYQEAKVALEAAGGDILDALVYLENQGKVKKPEVDVYSTKSESSQEFKEAAKKHEAAARETFGDQIKKFFAWCGKWIKKGCENFFIVSKNDEEVISLPVIVLILLIFAFAIVFPLLIVGLFFGFKYSFRGSITQSIDVNTACEKASEAAESIKQEFTK